MLHLKSHFNSQLITLSVESTLLKNNLHIVKFHTSKVN